jgi:phage tail protein X
MNRYQNIPITKSLTGKRIYQTSRYPDVPMTDNDIYVISVQGDRFDVLASQYYQDPSLWWVISIANDQLSQNSLIIPEGIQIRIPANPASVVRTFNTINS